MRRSLLILTLAFLAVNQGVRGQDFGCDRSTQASHCDGAAMWQPSRQCNWLGLKCGCPRDPGTLFSWPCQSSDAAPSTLRDPIVTDRPDFTEASSVVGLGVAQLELGYTYTFDNDGTNQTAGNAYPEALLRYGLLADWLELRVAWNWADEQVNNVSSSGAEDLYLGFKIGLTPQDGILPETAIIPQMTVPSGSSLFTNGSVLAGVNYLYGWDVNDWLVCGGSTQVNKAIDEATGGEYTEWAQSWTFGYSLAERVGAYTEWYAFFPSGADSARAQHYFNGGFTYVLTNDIQWDIRSGVGLNNSADDYFLGTGLSIRLQ